MTAKKLAKLQRIAKLLVEDTLIHNDAAIFNAHTDKIDGGYVAEKIAQAIVNMVVSEYDK